MNKRIVIVILIIAVIVAVVLISTGGRQQSSGQKELIKIGFIGPLTGDAAVYGLPLKNMVELAVEEINSQGGINGKNLEVIYEDGKCNGKDGATAMQKLVNVDNVEVVLGGFCSSESLGAEPIATENKVFLFSLGSSSPDLTGKSRFFARDYPSDATQGKVLAEVAIKNNWKKTAFIQEQLDYPLGVYRAFTAEYEKLGGTVVKEEFPSQTTDFRSILTKLKVENPDILFVDTQTPAVAERILNQLQELNWKPQIMVSDAVSGEPSTVKRNSAILEGALAAEFGIDENNPKFKGMLEAYKKKYGTDAPYLSYAQTEYDGVYIIRDAIKSVGYDGEKIAGYVRNLKDWQGASGSVTIGENGDRTGGHVPKIIRDGKVLLYQEVLEEKIKIGLSAPLTGEGASLGQGALIGAQVAVKEINSESGINGQLIELIIEDDQCSSKGINTFNKLVYIDKVTAIIGPACSAAAGPGIPVAQMNGVPTIIWASAPHLTKVGDYIFRNYPSDAFQGKFAAEYIFNKMGKKVAIIYVQNDWGKGIRDVFSERFKQLGGTVAFDEGVQQDAKDFRTVLVKAKEAYPEVIYFPVYPANGIAGLKQIKELGITVPVIGGDAFETDEVIKSEDAEGVFYTVGKINNPNEFKAKIKNNSDKDSNLVTPLAYDAINILAEVIKKEGTNKKAIRDGLAKVSYTRGVSLPLIEFNENGDLKTAEFEVKVIKNRESVIYNP